MKEMVVIVLGGLAAIANCKETATALQAGTCLAPKGASTNAEIPNPKLQVPKKFQASKFQTKG